MENFQCLSESSFIDAHLIEKSFIAAQGFNQKICAAAIEGSQYVPASDYHKGVDVAVLKYEAPNLGIPYGTYLMRVRSKTKISTTGPHEVLSEILNCDGETIYSWEYAANVTSASVPAKEDISVHLDLRSVSSLQNGKTEAVGWTLVVCCENGMCGTCICPGDGCDLE